MRRLFLLLFLISLSAVSFAQSRLISGQINDQSSKEPLEQVTIQLLKMDSTYVGGTISDEKGLFHLNAAENGKYLLKISSIGYRTSIKRIVIQDDKDLAMGKIALSADAIMLKEATVVGHAAQVVVKEDTFVYNSAAYRTPEGSVVEELVKKLPGAQISDDGTITINGKTVKKILVDGKEFMTGDTKTALKNLPTSIVDKIKAYDEKSDLARVTGIDDGNEQTVLDFGLKEGMHQGMFSNIDLSYGTHDRYAERVMGSYFNSKSRVMLFSNFNNVNDMGFPGGGRGFFGGGQQGLNATKMVGANYNYSIKNKIAVDASVRWNHSDGDVNTNNSSENFVSKVGSFSNSLNRNFTRSNSWDGRARLEWNPDTMTDIMFRPSFTYSTSDSRSATTSASYNDDPYKFVTDPLSAESFKKLAQDSLMVNSQTANSISYSDTKSLSAMLQYNRKLNSKGRNFTLRADGSIGKSDSKSLSTNAVHLYLMKTALGLDSTYQTNRYNLMPTKNRSYSLEGTYSEPIARAMYLQFTYQFTYNYSRSDRSTYDFSNLGEDFFDGVIPVYRGWNNYLSLLPNPLDSYLDNDLSRYSEYLNYIQEFNLMFRMIRNKFQLNAGVMLQPQKTKYKQNYMGVNVDTTRTVTNFSPTLDFRYKFSPISYLRVNYRGTSSQPSMSQLLDITDDSDPLNISKGNPGLKPSFTNSFRLFYNNYAQKHQRALMTYVNYSTTRNSISDKVTYDETTGGRITQPENINGNWNATGAFMFNTAIDTTGYFSVNTFTNLDYNHYVGYLSMDNTSDSEKNTTRTLTLGERLGGDFRNSWLDVGVDGSLNYTHARNELQTQSNMDTWQFAYGTTVNVTLPWGMTLATDLHENSRRGYSDASMNTNELIWNAQIGQSFLSGKPLTVTLQFYDILHNESNLSRTINATMRSDTQYNSINSYAMLHVIYRLNVFGNKEARQNMRGMGNRPDFHDPRFQGGSNMPGGRPHRGGGGGGFGGPRG
ncbi:MAG: outer membrane beta-barrel protein [Prevotella sp.]|jgi:hypothetical protein|nr:TonB-dependent receptor [Prevotella sp.]MCH3995551.1 outer membrane beta-barrel protein [Prevotella sp.]MCI1245979.1 outer membrane beta-barrel protein [Prevotella sp.]